MMSVQGAASRRRVLVVEDEMIVAWVLEDMLSSLGFEIVGPVAHVDQALALVDTQAFDVVSLDTNLNGEKSYPVADALIRRGMAFFFSTGYNKESIPIHYQNIPVLQKPYEAETLGAVISELLPRVP